MKIEKTNSWNVQAVGLEGKRGSKVVSRGDFIEKDKFADFYLNVHILYSTDYVSLVYFYHNRLIRFSRFSGSANLKKSAMVFDSLRIPKVIGKM